MTGLLVAGGILALIVLVGGIALFVLLPVLLALIGVVALIGVLAVAAVLLLPNFITLDQFKPQILEQLSKATGREILIGGPIGFSVWPVLGLQLSDISVGNLPGSADPIMISAKELGVGVSLKSLLDQKLDIQQIRLVGAQVNLSQNGKGKGNWELTPKESKPAANSEEGKASNFEIKDINIQSVEIVDTDIGYEKPGAKELELRGIQVSFAMPGLDSTAKLKGGFSYNGHKVSFNGEVAKPRALSRGEASPINMHVSVAGTALDYAGQLKNGTTTGHLEMKIDELARLLAVASGSTPNVPLKKLSLTTDLAASAKAADFKNLTVKADDLALAGKASVNLAGSRPVIDVDAEVSPINLDTLLPASAAVPAGAAGQAAQAAPDLSGLKAANADITLRLAGLTAKGLQVGATTARVHLQNGKLAANISPASFYGGTVAGKADLGSDAHFTSNVTLDGVNIEPVLKVLQGSARLSGKGEFTANVSGKLGPEMQRSLGGDGKLALRNGAIKGVNIAGLIRKAKGMLGQKVEAGDDSGQTDFSELTGSYTISRGLLTNPDLKLLSPLLRVNGKGTFDIPTQAVNYRVDGALVADLSGQGGVFDRKGLVIPINVTGKLGALSFSPDLQGLLLGNIGNAQAVGDAVKNLGTKEGQRELRGNIKDLLGLPKKQDAAPATTADGTAAPASAAAPEAPAQKKPNPADLLQNLLGGR